MMRVAPLEVSAKAAMVEVQPIELGRPERFRKRAVGPSRSSPIGGLITTDDPLVVCNAAALDRGLAFRRAPSRGSAPPATPRIGCAAWAYGADLPDVWSGPRPFVDKILKGANPGDIPIEQATRIHGRSANLKTAKALGIEIPPTLLAAADEVIE